MAHVRQTLDLSFWTSVFRNFIAGCEVIRQHVSLCCSSIQEIESKDSEILIRAPCRRGERDTPSVLLMYPVVIASQDYP